MILRVVTHGCSDTAILSRTASGAGNATFFSLGHIWQSTSAGTPGLWEWIVNMPSQSETGMSDIHCFLLRL